MRASRCCRRHARRCPPSAPSSEPDGAAKADLFTRVREILSPDGRFVLADVILPDDPADAVTSLTPGFDKPSSVAEQLAWLAAAGFDARVRWSHRDLAVIVGEAVYLRDR